MSALRHRPRPEASSAGPMFQIRRKKTMEAKVRWGEAELLVTTDTVQEVAISVWALDPSHSAVHFKVRHMAIAWVRGDFRISRGTLRRDEGSMAGWTMEVDIDSASVSSGDSARDVHLRSAEFLDVERYPSMRFRSTEVQQPSPDSAVVAGQLTIRAVTHSVELRVNDIAPATRDPWGKLRLAAAASTTINRKDFGLIWNMALEAGGVLVGDQIFIDLDVEFTEVSK